MNIRNIFIFIMTAAVLPALFTSCLGDVIDEGVSDRMIVVGVEDDAVTRSAIVSGTADLDGERIGFYAARGAASYLPKTYATVTGSGSNYTATLPQVYYWPIDRSVLKFFSWYPQGTTNPDVDVNTNKDRMKYTYEVNALAANQVDVMAAISQPAWGEPVPLSFYHMLTKVTFSFVKENKYVAKATVTKIEIRNVHRKGSVEVASIPSNGASGFPKFVWTKEANSWQNVSIATNTEVDNITGYTDVADSFLLLPTDTFADQTAIVITLGNGETRTFPVKDIAQAHVWESGAHINYRVTISNESFQIDAEPLPWTPAPSDWEIPTRYLNVSKSEASITNMNGARISFTSNMPYVWIGNKCMRGSDSGWDTSKYFNDIAAETWNDNNPTRFTYDPATGEGHFDLLTQPLETGQAEYTLYIYAGTTRDTSKALRKSIKVNVNATFAHNQYNYFDPIGAFFRFDETGERIMSGFSNFDTKNGTPGGATINSNGNPIGHFDPALQWSATLQYPAGTPEFVKMTMTPSFDPNLATDNPGDAEDYPVTDGASEEGSTIRGRGRMYFRIGTTPYTGDKSEPRYARIRVDYYAEGSSTTVAYTHYVYIRQGEVPAYIMRPEESLSDKAGTVIAASRTFARKVPVYNFTAPEYHDNPDRTDEFIKMPARSAYDATDGYRRYFTKYPTQAGTHQAWMYVENPTYPGAPPTTPYMRRAYHPSKPAKIDDWYTAPIVTGDGNNRYWGAVNSVNDINNETCPPGYRRPTDGTVTGSHNSYWGPVNYWDTYKDSEVRHSLFYEFPQRLMTYGSYWDGSLNNPPNAQFGVYSDGFFDRLPRGDWMSARASVSNADVAYSGSVVYHPVTFASVFFPAAGRREKGEVNDDGSVKDEPGALNHTGGFGNYWTKSALSVNNGDGTTTHRGIEFISANKNWNRMNMFLDSDSSNMGCSLRCFKE